MKKITVQLKGKLLIPYSEEDLQELKTFGDNQILKAQLTGTRRQRSLQQNKWLHVMLRLTSENTTDPDWDTPDKVKRNVKMAMKFFENDVIVEGNRVYFELRSFAFDEMEQNEADIKYNEAKLICAKKLKVDPKELEARAKEE